MSLSSCRRQEVRRTRRHCLAWYGRPPNLYAENAGTQDFQACAVLLSTGHLSDTSTPKARLAWTGPRKAEHKA